MNKFTLFIILIITHLPLKSQEVAITSLDSVVVSSSRIPQHMYETGRDMTVIGRDEIAQFPGESLDEILKFLPGIETQQRGEYGVQSDLSMRGSTFAQVVVLLDGMRINDPLTGHFNTNIPVSLAEIDRIEIIRGPSSAIYGPDAVGGIVNIITTSFVQNNLIERLHGSGSALLGQYGLFCGEGGVSGNVGKMKIGGSGRINTSKGFPYEKGIPGKFSLKIGSLSMQLPIGRSAIVSYRIGADHRNYSAWHFYTSNLTDSAKETTGSLWNQVRITKTGPNSLTCLDASLKRGTDNYLYNSRSLSNDHTTYLGDLHLSHRLYVTKNVSLMTGVQVWKQKIQSTDRGNHSSSEAGLYLLGLWKPVIGLSINGGIRGEYNSVYGAGFLPQVSASWRYHKLTLRAASGKSFRAPDFTERYIGTALPVLSPGRNLGNPALSAEKAWTNEAGSDLQLKKWLLASFTVFTRNAFDLIDYVPTLSDSIPLNDNLSPASNYFYASNISHLITNGMEFSLAISSKVTSHIGIQGQLAYTFLHTVSDEPIISKYLSNHSKHTLNGMLNLTIYRIQVSLTGLWKERILTESMKNLGMRRDFILWNNQLSYQLVPGKFNLDFRITNTLDRNNMDIAGLQMPGRWVSGGIRWNF